MNNYYRNQQFNRYYSAGSEARQLDVRQPVRKPETRQNAALKTRAEAQMKLKLVSVAFIMFLGLAAIMFKQSSIVNTQNNIAVIKGVDNEIDSIKAQIAENIDSKYIEKRAIEHLGMVRPKAHQIIYVSVPKENYTVQYIN